MSNGMIIYEGPSRLDGAPIVVIAVGLKNKSTNVKTGAMIQTYILRSDMPPAEAIKTGADASICGGCPHRGDGTGKGRSCYVTIMHGPRGVWMAYKKGNYPKAEPDVAGRMVRLGTYGDPAAVPIFVWQKLLKDAEGWTGYTHQWKKIHPAWATLCMASVDNETELHDAHAKGYRTFRVTPSASENIKGLEIICPASHEAGQKVECLDCRACMGTSGKAKVSIQIAAHGSGRSHVTAG
jgi:hypothetical protein